MLALPALLTVRMGGLQRGVAAHCAGRGAADSLAQHPGRCGVLSAAGVPITAMQAWGPVGMACQVHLCPCQELW